jgi:hypothetical protein
MFGPPHATIKGSIAPVEPGGRTAYDVRGHRKVSLGLQDICQQCMGELLTLLAGVSTVRGDP